MTGMSVFWTFLENCHNL